MAIKPKDAIIVTPAIILFYFALHLMGITCPIKALTGVSCPGCGMTRAWLAMMRGDLHSAFHYHPLFLLPAFALLVFIYRKHIPQRLLKGGCVLFIFLFLLVYVLRMIDPTDSIVVFEPQRSLIYQLFLKLSIIL